MPKELCVLCDNESRQELLLCAECAKKYMVGIDLANEDG